MASDDRDLVVPGQGVEIPPRQERQQLAGELDGAEALPAKPATSRALQFARDETLVEAGVVSHEDVAVHGGPNAIGDVRERRRLLEHLPANPGES